MIFEEVLSLAQKLITFDTSSPEGNENGIAKFIGGLLTVNGFQVRYDLLSPGRLSLVAEKGTTPKIPALVFSGHLDTVPLGENPWTEDPFAGTNRDGKIFGRGSSDMKCGVAAMVCAAVLAFRETSPLGGIRLIFTAGEEPGCYGAAHLAASGLDMGRAGAVVVGEPTSNIPYLGHKGALYLKISATGKTAHSSMPELGDNAIYKVARAISRIEKFRFDAEHDVLHGHPTINVGMVSGGKNLNSVPGYAEFTVDIRSTRKTAHTELLMRLSNEMGDDVTIEKLVDLNPVSTSEHSPFAMLVDNLCKRQGMSGLSRSLPYMTDGAVLQQLYGGVPTIILGPGEPSQAHQKDEFCQVEKIRESAEIYKNIIINYGGTYGSIS
jgi:succinyl-diaminopimelate desuccinylase